MRWLAFKLPKDRLQRWVVLDAEKVGQGRTQIGAAFRTEDHAQLAAAAPELADLLRSLVDSQGYEDCTAEKAAALKRAEELLQSLQR